MTGGLLAAAALSRTPDWNAILFCAMASLCLYAAGLLANDYFDRTQDAAERPERPLPSGRIRPGAVLTTAILLTAIAPGLASQAGSAAVGVTLLLTIISWSYNLGLKRLPIVGPLLMGTCRALSLLLGAAGIASSAILAPSVLFPAIVLALLISSITSLARRETETVRLSPWQVSLPPVILLIGLSAIFFSNLTPLPADGTSGSGGTIHHSPPPYPPHPHSRGHGGHLDHPARHSTFRKPCPQGRAT